LNAIHEGTHGIHGLDLLGRKVSMLDGALFKALDAEMQKTIGKAAMVPELGAYASALSAGMHRIADVTRKLYSAGDMNKTLANASVYLEAFGHVVVAWMWLEQALLCVDKEGSADADFYHGKLQACRYFFLWELPKIGPQLDLLDSIDTTTLDMQNDWF